MKLFSVAKFWIPLAFISTVLCALIYLTVQQNFRMSANDPQIQIAEDSALELNAQTSPESIVGNTKIDISKSLAPFLIIYNSHGEVVTANAVLHTSVPVLPQGVLQDAQKTGESRLTWQPETGVREAIVVVPYTNGYVLAGRSLKEVESREDALQLYVFGAWIVAVGGSLLLVILIAFLTPDHKKR